MTFAALKIDKMSRVSLSARLSLSSDDELARKRETVAAIRSLQMLGKAESELLEWNEGGLLMLIRPNVEKNTQEQSVWICILSSVAIVSMNFLRKC